MAEISHARARLASIGGLVIQLAASIGLLILSNMTASSGGGALAFYTVGGVLIWLTALLVMRQRELVVLEQRDLEQLRREKQAVGGMGVFEQEGGSVAYRVAEARLAWMQRWLVPGISLLTAAYLIVSGAFHWRIFHSGFGGNAAWPETRQPGLALVITALIMFFLFLYSRYASGMGRVSEWRLLRACGSYMLGNAAIAFVLIICYGLHLYAGLTWCEQTLAAVIPVLMILLGVETVLNFILDIYRPRTPGVEQRPAFDSRLLGLISEPGGFAQTIAEAINYQFGFQVSQTWFYRLVQRTLLPLAGFALLVLWLMTSVVIVHPYERAIIEQFGQQVSPESPLPPGLHMKLPWPFAIAHKHATGQLHQIVIGFKLDSKETDSHEDQPVVLWTDPDSDPRHPGRQHFNFIVYPTPRVASEHSAASSAPASAPARARDKTDVPVHILRMSLVVQYMIEPAGMANYLNVMSNTDDKNSTESLIRSVAWQELVRFTGSTDVDSILSARGKRIGESLAARIGKRLADLNTGVTIVYAGLQGVHPETTVAQGFERVIAAEQQKITLVRQAQVRENQILSAIAGDRAKARALAEAIETRNRYEDDVSRSQQALRQSAKPIAPDLAARLDALKPFFDARTAAEWAATLARAALKDIEQQFALGIGGNSAEIEQSRQKLEAARTEETRALAALDEALKPFKAEASKSLDPAIVNELVRQAQGAVGLNFWGGRLEEHFRGLEGEAAKILAEAQAERWRIENQAAAEFARLENERQAFAAAPELYKARRSLEALLNGMSNARKYFLAFDSGQRKIKLRIEAQETAVQDLGSGPSRKPDQP